MLSYIKLDTVNEIRACESLFYFLTVMNKTNAQISMHL